MPAQNRPKTKLHTAGIKCLVHEAAITISICEQCQLTVHVSQVEKSEQMLQFEFSAMPPLEHLHPFSLSHVPSLPQLKVPFVPSFSGHWHNQKEKPSPADAAHPSPWSPSVLADTHVSVAEHQPHLLSFVVAQSAQVVNCVHGSEHYIPKVSQW